MSGVLIQKLRRDVWRQRPQFIAVALVIGIGVAVYVAASDAYRNLGQSFDRAYATQLLPDVILAGEGVADLAHEVRALPGQPVGTVRYQADVGVRIGDNTFLGRAVSIPVGAQPEVSRLALRAGSLPHIGQVVIEQHLADHYGLLPGGSIDLAAQSGWRRVQVSGSALSPEYFWPARSIQEIMTTPEHFGVVFVPEQDLLGAVIAPTEQLLLYARDRVGAADLVAHARMLAHEHGFSVAVRDDQPSYRALQDDVEGIGTFARLLPWVFLAAAVLGTFVLLSRMVAAQRAIIGTLSANGMRAATLRRHYLGYGAAAGVMGAVPGLLGGYYLGGWFSTEYTRALGLPLSVTSLHGEDLLVGAAVGIASALLAAWAPARAAARIPPADAMRITPAHVRGGRSAIEVVVPPLRRLPARWRMTLRGVTRNRRRGSMTILGVVAAVSLVMLFAGLRDTVGSVIERQYGDIQLEDAEVHAVPGHSGELLREARADRDVAAAEAFGRYNVTLGAGSQRYDTLLVVLPQDTAMHRFTTTDGEVQLPAEGVLLGQGAGQTIGAGVDDQVTITLAQVNLRFEQRVAGFVDELMSPVAYMSLEAMQALAGAPEPTGVLLQLEEGASEDAVRRRVAALPTAVAYLSTHTVAAAMREAFALYDALVGLMLAFAVAMAIALLYNAMSANVAERAVELGTLQASGMSTGMLGRLVAAESMLLVAIGLPLGLGTGVLLADWFMSTYETQGSQWSLDMRPTTPLVVAVGLLAAAALVQIPAWRAARRTDVAKIVRERSL